MKRFLLVLALASSALAQTTINGGQTVKGAVDNSGATHTAPSQAGVVASLPGTCTVGDQYFATNATAGQNLYYCTAANTWTQQVGSAVSSVNGFTGAVCYIGALAVTPIVTGDWSVIGSGGSESNQTGPCGSAITVTGTTGGSGNVYGVKRAVVNGDFTHTLILYGAINQQNFSSIAAGFTDGTKVESCGATWLANSGELVILNTLTSALSGGTYNAANGNTLTHNANGSVWPLIIKLTRSGTALSCGVSYDQGITYYTSFTDTVPQQTPTHILVYADPRGASDAGHLTLVSYN